MPSGGSSPRTQPNYAPAPQIELNERRGSRSGPVGREDQEREEQKRREEQPWREELQREEEQRREEERRREQQWREEREREQKLREQQQREEQERRKRVRVAALKRAASLFDGKNVKSVRDHYDVDWEHPLGRGTFGTVYRAKHRGDGDNEVVALKRLHPTEEDQMLEVANEVMYLKKLRGKRGTCHENAPCLVDYFSTTNENSTKDYYIAMKLIDGKSLADYIDERRAGDAPPMTAEQAGSLVNSSRRALQYVHKQGLAHRDIKPENIMVRVDKNGNPHAVLVDVGLACINESECNAMRGQGTPTYMSPVRLVDEILLRKDLTFEEHQGADYFSLGLSLAYALDEWFEQKTRHICPYPDSLTRSFVKCRNQRPTKFANAFSFTKDPVVENEVRAMLRASRRE